jgi:hypothetical protein
MDKAEQMQAAEKHALVQTCNTPGWRVVMKIADAIVQESIDSALGADEVDQVKRFQAAKAAKVFYETLINRIDQQKFVDAGPDPQFEPQDDF